MSKKQSHFFGNGIFYSSNISFVDFIFNMTRVQQILFNSTTWLPILNFLSVYKYLFFKNLNDRYTMLLFLQSFVLLFIAFSIDIIIFRKVFARVYSAHGREHFFGNAFCDTSPGIVSVFLNVRIETYNFHDSISSNHNLIEFAIFFRARTFALGNDLNGLLVCTLTDNFYRIHLKD